MLFVRNFAKPCKPSLLGLFPDGSVVKNLLPMQETQEMQVRSPDPEDPLRRIWQPTPVFLTEKFHGQKSWVNYSPWGRKESDIAEWAQHTNRGHSCPCLLWDVVGTKGPMKRIFKTFCWGFRLTNVKKGALCPLQESSRPLQAEGKSRNSRPVATRKVEGHWLF